MLLTQRPGGDYAYITDDTPTLVHTGEGILKRIIINKALTGTIKVIDTADDEETTANIATITNPAVGDIYPYGCDFTDGLLIVASGACDITVVSE